MLGFAGICQNSWGQEPYTSKPTIILVLGDSISAEYGIPRNTGWVSLLSHRLDKTAHQVINASISGETTSGGKQRIEALLAKHNPHILIIELGANDALRGLSLQQSQSNLEFMIRAGLKSHAKIFVLGMKIPPNYGKEYALKFERMYPEVTKKMGVNLYPFFLEKIATNLDMFQTDRIHPNQKAQAILLDTIWPQLSNILKTVK